MKNSVIERIAMHPFFRNLTAIHVPAHQGQDAFNRAEKGLITASGDIHIVHISEVFHPRLVPDLTYIVGAAEPRVRLAFHFDRARKNCLCLEARTAIGGYPLSGVLEQGKYPGDLDDLFEEILQDLRPVHSFEELIAVGAAARQKLAP
ncbi:MAG TPA: hypothetical protein PKX87_05730 [Alphaproteobacteria bacterium]|nr:hypothetical protein [Alphaproteobacteria bacterium]